MHACGVAPGSLAPGGCTCLPAGLLEVLMTGGLPPGVAMPCSADAVYMACHK